MELLGVKQNAGKNSEELEALDLFWSCYEIMGVALTELKVWQWLYDHPGVSVGELKEANLRIAKEVWNQYYAPVFKVSDQTILAVYSHAVIDPLYLAASPLGHLIDYQLATYFRDKTIGPEVIRMYKQGRVTPKLWMQRSLNSELSAQPLLDATEKALKAIK